MKKAKIKNNSVIKNILTDDDINDYLSLGQLLLDLKDYVRNFIRKSIGKSIVDNLEWQASVHLSNFIKIDKNKFPDIMNYHSIPTKYIELIKEEKGIIVAKIVKLGFQLDYWWKKKHKDEEIFNIYEKRLLKTIKDLDSIFPTTKKHINSLIKKYKPKAFNHNFIDEMYEEIADVITKKQSNLN